MMVFNGHKQRKNGGQIFLLSVFFTFVLLVGGNQLLIAEESEVMSLSFSKAVQTALLNNPDIKSSKAEIDRKLAEKQKTTASFMPVVDIYTDYTTGDAPSASLFTSIDKRELEAGTDFNNPGNFTNFESGVKAHLLLFNGGRNIIARKAADDFLEAAHAGRQSVVNRITADVMTNWFQVLSAESFIKISEETVDTIQKELEIMTIRFKGGSVLKSDILSLKVRLAEAEEGLIKNNSSFSIAKASLAVLLGLSPDTELLINTNDSDFSIFNQNTKNRLNNSMTKQPEIVKATMSLMGTKKNADRAKRFYSPTIQLAGKYYLDDEDMKYSTDRENWTVGVMMNWNLFSGLTNLADKKKAAADLSSARQAKRKTELSVKFDMKKSALLLEEAEARLTVTEKNKDLAEESLMLVKKQYEGGAVNITRYLDAELAYSMAKTRLATAEFDKMVAIVETARASGFLADPDFVFKNSTIKAVPSSEKGE